MNNVIETGSDALMCIPCFIKTHSAIQTLIGHTHTESKVISQAYCYFFQNKESRLKRC
jgi:hypothetical protein